MSSFEVSHSTDADTGTYTRLTRQIPYSDERVSDKLHRPDGRCIP